MFTMNPTGPWSGSTSCRSPPTKASARATVSASVSSATTTSTRFITGTGEKKCRPTTRSGCCVQDGQLRDRDRRGVGRDDRGRGSRHRAPEDGPLISGSSKTASMTRSESASVADRQNQFTWRSAPPGGVQLAAANRAVQRRPSAFPRAVQHGGLGLERATWSPVRATDSAMPEPMKPAPTIADGAQRSWLVHRANSATYAERPIVVPPTILAKRCDGIVNVPRMNR